MDEKSNALRFASSDRVIIYVKNKSFFYSTIKNQEWVLIIEIISEDRKKDLIFMIFKRLNIKPA